jgi:hypothetical protein
MKRRWQRIKCFFGKHAEMKMCGAVKHCTCCGAAEYYNLRMRCRYAWFGLWD